MSRKLEIPPDVELIIGIDDGIRSVRNGDEVPDVVRVLGIRFIPGVARAQMPSTTGNIYWPSALFNVALGVFIYRKWGAICLMIVAVILHLFLVILKNSYAIAKQRAASSAPSSASTTASTVPPSGA
jgi:hypothetical protein